MRDASQVKNPRTVARPPIKIKYGMNASMGVSLVVVHFTALAVCEDFGHVCLRPGSESARHVVEREALTTARRRESSE
jgi:hypothetical protein